VAPQLWAMEQNGDYQVNAVDDMNNTELGFIKGEDSTYTITFTHSNISTKYVTVSLLDMATNTTTDITQSGSSYTFKALSGAQVNRFRIITSSNTTTDNPKVTIGTLRIYNSQETIYVNNPGNLSGELSVYNIAGRCIQTCMVNANSLTVIPTSLITGAYVVKVSTSNETISKRIIIQ